MKRIFLSIVLIIAMASLFTKFSIRKLVIIVAILIVMPIAMDQLYKLYQFSK